jgi:hypothetical protein
MKILGPLLSSDWRSINLKEQTVARLSGFWREGDVERLLGQSFTLQENGEKIWGFLSLMTRAEIPTEA